MIRRPTQNPPKQSVDNSLLPRAVALHQAGRLGEAVKIYEKILENQPRQFDATHLLGVIALQEGRLEQAQALITSALESNPDSAPALGNLGAAYLRAGKVQSAYTVFERAANLDPNSPAALTNLGTALHRLNRPRDAMIPLRRAYAANPKSAEVCNVLGSCLFDIGDRPAAVELFDIATRLEPQNPDGWVNLASALNSMAEHERALACAEKAIAMGPPSSAALAVLAAIQFEMRQIATSIETYRSAIALPDATSQIRCGFANALLASGLCEEAIDHLRQAIEIDGSNPIARWRLAMAHCQPFYREEAEVFRSRHAFSQALLDCRTWFQSSHPAEAYNAVGSNPPFYLAYQPFLNKDILTQYGEVCVQWMTSLAPGSPAAGDTRRKHSGSPIATRARHRIGIASAHIRNHSVWHAIVKGWIQHLDKARFELYVFGLSILRDGETDLAKREAVHFEDQPSHLQAWIDAVARANLDVLIYPDIGMDPLTTQLASLRLAPVQATSWGHPETTGLPHIDLFISADAFETPSSQRNYTERLVSLPNLGVFVEPLAPAPATVDLRSLRLPEDEPLLLCPGSPFKYLPLHDRVWARIAKGLSKRKGGRLVFFRSGTETLPDMLYARLRNAFKRERVDFDARVCSIPSLDRSAFYGLMRRSVLMLDTLGFSGFNTALQAAECGLPFLSYEGEFMRGRLASGIMRRMGLPELVATSDEDFIDRAIGLAGDASTRDRLSIEIANRREILFHDLEPIRALESSLIEAIARSRGTSPVA